MTDWSSNVHDLHPPGGRLALRGRAAELLIQATNPAQAGLALFELIAAELKLNAFLLYLPGDDGRLELIAHGGLSEAEAVIAAAQDLSACGGRGKAPAQLPLTGHITSIQEPEVGATFLRSLGLEAWFGQPLMGGEHLLGVIGFGRRWAGCFHDEDLAFLQSVAHYLALALERLRGEAALRESEQRLQLGMTVAGFGTYDYNLITDQMIVSPETFAILGLAPGQPIIAKLLGNGVHPDDRARVLAARLASYNPDGGGEYAIEYRWRRPDGVVRWVHARAQTFFAGEAGARRAVRVIGAIRDITESKLVEQRLRESEERLRLATEAGGFGVFDYDVDRDEAIWSPELRAIYGFGPGEIIDLKKVLRQVHPDDRDRYLAPTVAVRASGDFGDYLQEYRIFRPDGEMRWVASSARQMFTPDSEQPRRIIGVCQDITARKLAEQRLRDSEERLRDSEQRLQLAQDLGGVASYDLDPVLDEMWVSQSYRQIFGLPPNGVVNSKAWKQLVHPDDQDRAFNQAAKILETGESQEAEYRIVRPSDQQVRWIYSAGGAVQNTPGAVTRLVGICLDITERKRNDERERLLSREVDHRAKNLLSVVQAMVQLTRADSIPEFVSQIKGRILALGRVHGLLAASRWNGAELSRLIAEELAPFSDDGGRVRLSGPSVALRPAPAQSIALVIHELTTNAVKYGALSVPGGRIEVEWQTGDAVAGRLVLRWIESGGPIIPPPRHFGFGLTHIRGSVERQLGGDLDLQWRPEGLQCVVSLPSRQLVPD